jgi:hypothetical protein
MTENTISKRKLDRSTSYPILNLKTAIDRLITLHQSLGKGPYSREDATKGMGYSGLSGASSRAVAALVQYGLLDRVGNTYSISLLSNDILHPESEIQKNRALKVAATKPKIFSTILKEYQGQSLPTMLENILIRKNISSNCAKDVVANIKETFMFAGILVNGVVNFNQENTNETDTEKKEELLSQNQTDTNQKINIQKDKTNDDSISIVLGPDITIVLSKRLIEKIALGQLKDFSSTMEKLKEFSNQTEESDTN